MKQRNFVKHGRRERMSFSTVKQLIDPPNFIEIQQNSFEWFLKEGLKEAFEDISPVEDYTGNLVLEFVDYQIGTETKYDEEECKERDANYAVQINAKLRFINKETGEVKEQNVYMGRFPLMTDKGTFIINGAERVVVSQLVRSPGAYNSKTIDKISGLTLYSSQIIPNRGAWIEYETDTYEVLQVRIDKKRKIPLTVLIKALGIDTREQILETFGSSERLLKTLEKDITKNQDDALKEIYKKLKPNERDSDEAIKNQLKILFFEPKRYDLAKVGRYKFNKKLSLLDRIEGHFLATKVINDLTGEVIANEGDYIDHDLAKKIDSSGLISVDVYSNDNKDKIVRVLGNHFVDIEEFVDVKKHNLKIGERVYYPLLKEILLSTDDEDELVKKLEERKVELCPKYLLIEDIFATISYFLTLPLGVGEVDDIDHLGNRRIRSVGELLQNQFRIGLSRMERSIRERMTTQNVDQITPQGLINIRPLESAIKEFFGSSQLSQFMDQTNPIAELTNKRRLSALGPGGLQRDRAGFEVRDVHYSHYGRMCPIETPEGPNIGLIGYLSIYARVNEYGFIETPYRVVDKENRVLTDEIKYIRADEEDRAVVIPAVQNVDQNGKFLDDMVSGRYKSEIAQFSISQVDYCEVSAQQMVSVATSMIPFLENDDATRALMGSNMQRQAVPLIRSSAPYVGTGIEYDTGLYSGAIIRAKKSGVVEYSSAEKIVIKNDDMSKSEYKLLKFKRSNQGTCINQRSIVRTGMRVEKGEVIADGPSTDLGEISLGTNLLVGFMTWEGYNYEDAILLSEEVVKYDILSSIHIEKYEIEARDTKLGPEEITRDISNVPDDALKNLDERGIIVVGSEVTAGDILVGKVTPKGETELTPEERLLRVIFAEKVRDVKDRSLRVPHGEGGIVVDVKVFTSANGDELSPGVNMMVRVYIAKKGKIQVGDKMAGRHGNKGVVSKILPVEDMPFLDDGTPLQILLNPLGVPSRMNIGQVLEVHLGLAAKKMGWYVATPVFDGANEIQIMDLLEEAGYPRNGKLNVRDGRTGEYFDNPVTVGYMYMLKLHHLVDDKLHARSIGPYSLVTQQPLGGKAQFGGQRFGEMEVWALEAYGASHTLQEVLTVKSDDIAGRVKAYESIVQGENIPEPSLPESFKVLVKELQSLALDVKIYHDEVGEVKLEETIDEIEDINDYENAISDMKEFDNTVESDIFNDEYSVNYNEENFETELEEYDVDFDNEFL